MEWKKKSRLVYDLEQPQKDPYETQEEILINGVLKIYFKGEQGERRWKGEFPNYRKF